jgi:hypothetical protein
MATEKPMHEYSVRWEIVNGMHEARRRGHGQVRPFLASRGVPPANGYRWMKDLRALVEEGPQQLRHLKREVQQLTAQLADRGPAQPAPVLDAKAERNLMLVAAARGNSLGDVAALLAAAGGRSLSHSTVQVTLGEWEVVAWATHELFFKGHGTEGALDEMFAGRDPALLIVEPRSLLVSGAKVAEGRGAEHWKSLVAEMAELEFASSDAAAGLTKALERAGVARSADLFHLMGPSEVWLARFEKKVRGGWAAVERDRAVIERPAGRRGRPPKPRFENYEEARQAADREIADWCRLGGLLEEAKATTSLVTPTGELNTEERAAAKLAAVRAAMSTSEAGQALAATLGVFDRQPAFAHLRVLAEKLAGLGPAHLGPDAPAQLARLVAETVAWRRTDKTSVARLAQASTGSLADEAELQVLRAVDAALRSSSAVECVNSRLRRVQNGRKRLGGDFIYLWAVHHNMRPFGRGSVRAGQSPAQLADLKVPTNNWIELLELVKTYLDSPPFTPFEAGMN